LFDEGIHLRAEHPLRSIEKHIPTEYARNIEISSPSKARETSPVKLIFAVDNVPAERNRLEALGITMLQRPWQNATEQREGVDPEDDVFQISAVRL
jgi:hypothetical protein